MQQFVISLESSHEDGLAKIMLQVAEAIDALHLTSLAIGLMFAPHKGGLQLQREDWQLPIVPRKLQSLELGLGNYTRPHGQSLGLFRATLTNLTLYDNTDLEKVRHLQCLSALLQLWLPCSLNSKTALTVEKDLAYFTAFTRKTAISLN